MKEIEPLKPEIVTEEKPAAPVNREEVVKRVISLLTRGLAQRAIALGQKRANKRGKGSHDSGLDRRTAIDILRD